MAREIVSTLRKAQLPLSLSASPLRKRLLSGAFWSFLATAASQGLNFAAFVITARLLSKSGFGEFGMIQSTLGMFGIFAGMGLGVTATKHVAELKASSPERAGHIIALSLFVAVMTSTIAALGLFLSSDWLSTHALASPSLSLGLRIGCLLLVLNTLNGTQAGTMVGFEAFRCVARVNLLQGIVGLPLIVLGVIIWGLPGAIGAMVVAAAVGCILNHISLRRIVARQSILLTLRGAASELPILWRFSLPALLTGAMAMPAIWFANTLVVSQPQGYDELAVFSAASRFQSMLSLLGTTMGTAMLPMLASTLQSKSAGLRRTNVLITWILGVSLAVPLITFPEIGGLIFGEQYTGSHANRTIVIVMCYTCVLLYKDGIARALIINDLMWWGFLSNFIWACILIPSVLLLRHLGSTGLALAFLIAYLLNTAIFVPLYTRRDLVPRDTIVSPAAAVVWFAVILLAGLSFLNFSPYVRGVGLLAAGVLLFLAFRNLRGAKGAV